MKRRMLKRFLLPLSLLLVAPFFACSDDVARGPGSETTNGIVASIGGTPVPFARVSLRSADYEVAQADEEALFVAEDFSQTDSLGRFNLEVPEVGDFRLTVIHDGVAFTKIISHAGYAELDSIGRVDLNATATLTGVVDVPAGSKSVWVGVMGTDVLVRSDSNGVFVIPAMPANDTMQLYVRDASYTEELLHESVFLTPYEQVLLDYKSPVVDTIEIPADTVHKVSIVFANKTPASYATVALRKEDARVQKYFVRNVMAVADLHADKNGQFVMEWPESGTYRLTVSTGSQSFSAVYSAEELPLLDTLTVTSSVMYSSSVSLKSDEDFAWVGVYGLDELVKTDAFGSYVLPSLPANDSLTVYFVHKDSAEVFVEWPIETSSVKKSQTPFVLLYDFEKDNRNWYMSVDTLKKGSAFYNAEGVADTVRQVKDYLVSDTARDSKVFHSEYSVAYDPYAWALIGTRFEETMNLSSLDSIELYIKGNGHVKVAMENWESYEKGTKASSSWIPMESDWQRVVFKPSDLCVNSEGKNDCENVWNEVKTGVRQIHIFLTCGDVSCYQDPKRVVDIDDVKLYGVLF